MKGLAHFETMEGYARYRPSGRISLAGAVRKVTAAIGFSREQGVRQLLVDTRKWRGFGSPGTLERFDIASAWAQAADSQVKVVMVARPEMIDPDRFGVIVARNRGLLCHVFASEAEALAWLLGPNAQ